MTSSDAPPLSMNVLMVIDTEYVKSNFPYPSKDMSHPTGVDQEGQFMIATGTRGITSGQASAELNIKAVPGDLISLVGTSISANSDDAVIVYRIKHRSRDRVLNQFQIASVTRKNAVMASVPDTLPPVQTGLSFCRHSARVIEAGTEIYNVYMALYALAEDRETQELYGYYNWEATITIG